MGNGAMFGLAMAFAAIVGIVFKAKGILPDFTLAMVAIAAAAAVEIWAPKRLLRWGYGILVAVFVVLPVGAGIIRLAAPALASSLGLRGAESEVLLAAKLYPPAVTAEAARQYGCNQIDEARSLRNAAARAKLVEIVKENPSDSFARETILKLDAEIADIRAERERCKPSIGMTAPAIAIPGVPAEYASIANLVAIIGGVLLAVWVIARMVRTPATSAAVPAAGAGAKSGGDSEDRANFTLMVLFVAGMILWYVYWPGMTAEGSIIFCLLAVGGGALLLALIRGESYWGWAFTSIVLAVGGIFIAAMYRPGIF